MIQRLDIDNQLFLSPLQIEDIPVYLQHLNNKAINDELPATPFPYTIADAQLYLNYVRNMELEGGCILGWAIREKSGVVICEISFHGQNITQNATKCDEIGYWLAEPFWGKGIMSRAVGVVCSYGRDVRKLKRIEAYTYSSNIASERVLVKCGFKQEAYLCKSVFVNNKYLDAKLLALTY